MRLTIALTMISATCEIAGCAGAPHGPARTAPPAPEATAPSAPVAPAMPDPDLHRPPPRRLLDIDWASTRIASDAEALALWQRIAPTGADWDDKLDEIPATAARPLAIALLRGGNFACVRPPAGDCGKPRYDVDPPAATAGLDDPCLRRLLALWSITQLEDSDAAAVQPALLAIAQLPPPESQLVSAAIQAVPEADHDARLALLAAAWRAGQRDLVDAAIGTLDEPHLVLAARKHHIAGALEVLAAADHRAVYLAAITDEALPARARISAIGELIAGDDKLAPDVRAQLVAAAGARDCQVAATAARTLEQRGDRRFVPRRPRTQSTAAAMRALCVLASYETLQQTDEPSLLAGYVPARGLERITITYDALSDTDADGDGDPHTTHAEELVPRADVVLPEIEDLVRAMQRCTGTVCVSDDREFHFVWKASGGELLLTRLEMADRLPCPDRQTTP